jgi:signal transduction histidine kinase
LTARRDAILQAWLTAVDRDPQMMTGASLPKVQLADHVPQLLEAFTDKLLVLAGMQPRASVAKHTDDAAAHGLQRWQQGYDLREVTREWARLQMCMADELERYVAAHPELERTVMPKARRAWLDICTEGVGESTAQFFHLQQIEAKGHVRDLEQAVKQMQTIEQQRVALWREAAHDVRGNLGVVVNATTGLGLQGMSESSREDLLRMLKRNVVSLHSLLEDVTDLARLQAGQELRQVAEFDAAAQLHDLCERMNYQAAERDLYLKTEGPPCLLVRGDAVKVQRIVQNLLVNAIKYTRRGGVTLSWGDSRANDPHRWMVCVQDTGPGFHSGPGAMMAGALEAATEESRHSDAIARGVASPSAEPPGRASGIPPDSRPVHQERGEGIGLSIVKRLCELLDATIEMDSKPGEGTTIRVLFPRDYATSAK